MAAGITIESVRDHVVGVDRKVPIHDGREVPYVNLDNAATTPDEVDYAIEALRAVLADGPKAEYVLDPEHLDYVPTCPVVRLDDFFPI